MTSSVAERRSNAGILRYLADGAEPGSVPIERPTPRTNTWRLGAHPDVVARLWTDMNAALPADSRYLIAGGAALAHPTSGVILAVALGTAYALWLAPVALAEALARGHETSHSFATVERTLDLTESFGPGWVFGRFDENEPRWLATSYVEAGR